MIRLIVPAAFVLLALYAPASAQVLPVAQPPIGEYFPFSDVDELYPGSGQSFSQADDFDAGAGLTVTDITLWGAKASMDPDETFTLVFHEDGETSPDPHIPNLPGEVVATYADVVPVCQRSLGGTDDLQGYVYQIRLPEPVVLGEGFKWMRAFSSRADGVIWRWSGGEFDPARGRFGLAGRRNAPGETWGHRNRLGLAFALNAGDLFCPDADGVLVPDVVAGAVSYGTCSTEVSASGRRCRVRMEGQNGLPTAQRYTLFLRLDGPGGVSRTEFRGEVKLGPGEDASREIPIRLKRSDPAGTYVVRAFAEYGSVSTLSDSALVFETSIFEPVVLRKEEAPSSALRATDRHAINELAAFPNPAAEEVTLRFAIPGSSPVTLVVYDALGRQVARPLDRSVVETGSVSVDVSSLPPGLYVARLIAERHVVTGSFVVAR